MITKVNLKDIDSLFYFYEPIVVSIANKIYNSLYFIPAHIREEFIHEARYSLIMTLNNYSKKYNSDLRPVALKTEIIWKCYDHISDWWVRTYCGCKKWSTQKKHKLFPISKEDMELANEEEDEEMQNRSFNNSPLEDLIDKEEREISVSLLKIYKRKLRFRREVFDCLTMSFDEYNKKYPDLMTRKSHDNNKQLVRRKVIKLIEQEEYLNKRNNTL